MTQEQMHSYRILEEEHKPKRGVVAGRAVVQSLVAQQQLQSLKQPVPEPHQFSDVSEPQFIRGVN